MDHDNLLSSQRAHNLLDFLGDLEIDEGHEGLDSHEGVIDKIGYYLD